MKHSRPRFSAHTSVCSFRTGVLSARREFARFLLECSHVERARTAQERERERGGNLEREEALAVGHCSEGNEDTRNTEQSREKIEEFPRRREAPKIRIISRRGHERFMVAFSSLLRNSSLGLTFLRATTANDVPGKSRLPAKISLFRSNTPLDSASRRGRSRRLCVYVFIRVRLPSTCEPSRARVLSLSFSL